MKRRPPPQAISHKRLDITEMKTGIARISKRLEELEAFDAAKMSERHPPELTALSVSIMRALEKTFGEGSADTKRFSSASNLAYRPMVIPMGEPIPLSEYRDGVGRNVIRARALLKEAIRTLQEDLSEEDEAVSTNDPDEIVTEGGISQRVFVVHGHDDGAREGVARFLEKLGLEPVILHEQPNKGRTIITKFQEEAADIGFAVVLMTPDDFGGKASGEAQPRARQNVVFELGFFIGALGPERVAALVKGDLERPSDFDGVVYISLDHGSWKADLGRELEAAGYDVDWNKVMKA